MRTGTLASAALAVPAVPQDRPVIEFGGAVYDVTGAGTLELGDIDPVLKPFLHDFRDGLARLELEFTVHPSGVLIGCHRTHSSDLATAADALCAHALGTGRFVQSPQLALDYTQATYRITVHGARTMAKDAPLFRMVTGFPLEGSQVRFGSYDIPPDGQRLRLADLKATPMEYPQSALRAAIEARVIVAITFDAEGRTATCRPISSTNTARMAYETCRAARQGFRLASPPDARPFVWVTTWMLAD